jgi:hypothetical protein
VAVLRMAPKAKGNFTNEWTRNKSIPESDHTRVYRFDVQSKRLTGLQVLVGNTVVLETTAIRYNEPINPATFALALPENATFSVDPEQMPANRPLPQTARETAVRFFDALATQDLDGLRTVSTHADERFLRGCGGLTVISIGEPFQSGLYAGWFVPYQVKFANGEFKQHNLAVRNDNPAHRWHMDGGF